MKTSQKLALAAAVSLSISSLTSLPAFARSLPTTPPVMHSSEVDARKDGDTTFTLTVQNIIAGHTYAAFQIFKGDLKEVTVGDTTTRTLSNLEWGDGITTDGIKALLIELMQYGGDAATLITETVNSINNTSTAVPSNDDIKTFIDNLTEAALKHADMADAAGSILAQIKTNQSSDDSTIKSTASKTIRTIARLFSNTANVDNSHKSILTPSADGDTASAENLSPGYYVVTDSTSDTAADPDVLSLNILQVVSDITVGQKSETVSSNKYIKNLDDKTNAYSDWQKYADYDSLRSSISTDKNYANGIEIPMKLEFTLPANYDDFTQYTLCFRDSLNDGITLLTGYEDSASTDYYGKIKVYLDTLDENGEVIEGATTVLDRTDDKFYYIIVSPQPTGTPDESVDLSTDQFVHDNNAHLEIYFKDLKQISSITKNTRIRVEYFVTLNENANFGSDSPVNTMYCTFSNNPNFVPTDEDPTNEDGKTVDSSAKIYNYQLEINKMQPGDSGNVALNNVEFTLYKKVLDPSFDYDENSNVEQGPLEDNTNDAIWGITQSEYDALSDDKKEPEHYEIVDTAPGTTDITQTISETEVTSQVNCKWIKIQTIKLEDKNVFYFNGLDAGDYLLKETYTPAGYNTIKEQEFSIVPVYSETPNTDGTYDIDHLTAIGEDGDPVHYVQLNTTTTDPETGDPIESDTILGLTTTILNKKGSILPTTGGTGTTLLYIAGILILITGLAGTVLKRRKKDR